MSASNNKEYALFISNPCHLRYWKNRHYMRIYFGNEFCDQLLPTRSQLRYVLCFCEKHNMEFSLVTPYCTNSTLRKIEPLLDCLRENTEVIFNDFGLLKLIKIRHLTPVLGRLLVSVAKDPRVPPNSEASNYYKTSNLQRPLLTFLYNNKIFRAEVNNIKQGYNLTPWPKIQLSLYTPYVYCAITRKCTFSNLGQSNAFFKITTRCHRECQNKSLRVKISDHSRFIYIKGRTEYYINRKKNLFYNPQVDRIVYMPVFPI